MGLSVAVGVGVGITIDTGVSVTAGVGVAACCVAAIGDSPGVGVGVRVGVGLGPDSMHPHRDNTRIKGITTVISPALALFGARGREIHLVLRLVAIFHTPFTSTDENNDETTWNINHVR